MLQSMLKCIITELSFVLKHIYEADTRTSHKQGLPPRNLPTSDLMVTQDTDIYPKESAKVARAFYSWK